MSSGGLLGQVKQTRESIDEVRDLGERTLFYVQRAALLARWLPWAGFTMCSEPARDRVAAGRHRTRLSIRGTSDLNSRRTARETSRSH